MIFNFNKFLVMNENNINLKIGDYVFMSDDSGIFNAPWEGSYGKIVDNVIYGDSDIYLVKILSNINDEIKRIIGSQQQYIVSQRHINNDELWVHNNYLKKYKSLKDLKTASYIFKNKKEIDKYNL